MAVWFRFQGLENEYEEEGELLGQFVYDQEGESLQMFHAPVSLRPPPGPRVPRPRPRVGGTRLTSPKRRPEGRPLPAAELSAGVESRFRSLSAL